MHVPHVVSHHSMREAPYPERIARLGRALMAISHDLADSRRAVARLERENAALRERLHDLRRI